MSSLADVAGRRVATSYDVLVRSYLASRGVEAQTVHLDGAVESSVQLGVADLIADVVETGTTLRAAGLETRSGRAPSSSPHCWPAGCRWPRGMAMTSAVATTSKTVQAPSAGTSPAVNLSPGA